MNNKDEERARASATIEVLTKEQASGLCEGVQVIEQVGPWQVTAWWPIGSQGGPAEVTIKPHPEADPADVADGVTVGVLRTIPLVTMGRGMAAYVASNDDVRRLVTADDVESAVALIIDAVERNPRPGRTGRPEIFHLAVATAYAFYAARGDKNPVQSLADAVGAPHRAATGWVKLARENGMLSATAERRAGGTLTDKAVQLIERLG